MGVVGTPCQIMAVAQYRLNPMKRSDVIDPVNLTIGLFCTWALDTRRLIALLSDRMDCASIVKMDVPPPPADIFTIETRDGTVEISLDDIRSRIPEGCAVCPDMTSEWSDISVGNLEGSPEWNTILIRTEKGIALIEDAVNAGWLAIREMPSQNLAHLTSAAANKKQRALIKARAEGLLNTSGADEHSAMRINAEVVGHIIGTEAD
jgi:coenzyme F420 hydrogenase subunit beta